MVRAISVFWYFAIRPALAIAGGRFVYALAALLLGYDPMQAMAAHMVSIPSEGWLEFGRWAFIGALALLILGIYEWRRRVPNRSAASAPAKPVTPGPPPEPEVPLAATNRDVYAAVYLGPNAINAGPNAFHFGPNAIRIEQNIHSNNSTQTATPSPPSPVTSTGFKITGGAADSCLAIGFETGFESIGAELKRNVAMRDAGGDRAFPATTGEFSDLSLDKLRHQIKAMAAELRSFDARHADIRDSQSIEARETEFIVHYLPRSASLASEALYRLKRVEIPNNTPIFYGMEVLRLGRLAGMDPVGFAAHFLDYIAERL